MKDTIKDAVQEHYAAVARGEQSACGSASKEELAVTIGYSAEDLALAGDANLGLGCGNPLAMAAVQAGMTVLDLGSGAGFDAFLAWRRVGPSGLVIGVDMTDDMLSAARANAEKLGASNVEFRKGYIEQLPVEDNSVDFVISNCVINLSPDKPAVFGEIARVLKPGGRVQISDISLAKPVSDKSRSDPKLWAECVVGAVVEDDYVAKLRAAGLEVEVISRFDYFAGSASADTRRVAHGLGAHTIVMRGTRA